MKDPQSLLSPENGVLVGWTTVDSAEAARRLASGLVENQLAACVQIDPPMEAVFPWKGKVETETEWRLWIKTRRGREKEVLAYFAGAHPYEVPQWVAVAAASVHEGYHAWLCGATAGKET
ncbi:MAG: divalent cation tolerance protein CutA [Verrucomicrobia bacterium]|nr:divalent cation tolerance protein CutA [Verrucomicrobiota bacterium]